MISKLDLIGGNPIPFKGGCFIKQPTLGDIRSYTGVGMDLYNQYRGLLTVTLEESINAIGLLEWYVKLSDDEKNSITVFDILTLIEPVRDSLTAALSFFICGDIRFDEDNRVYDVLNSDGVKTGEINNQNYHEFQKIICEICNVERKESKPLKFRSEKERQIYEKRQEMKRKAVKKQRSENPDMALDNLISAVAAAGKGYNLFNIWDLTVYQLTDQFQRINTSVVLSIFGTRWAAWGKDDFDFEVWYKNMDKKEK